MKKSNLYVLSVILRILIIVMLLFAFGATQAQPLKEYYGCKARHHHYFSKAAPLSPAELLKITTSNERSDTIDILHYNLNLDFTNFSQAIISGNCEIHIQSKMDDVNSITLDLLDLNIDSVEVQGVTLDYNYDSNFLTINFESSLSMDDELTFTIHYNGHPTPAASGFGGLVFQGSIAYNLGIGLGETPYNYGRGWFPCFDSFVERSTFEFNIISNGNKRAYCVGTFTGQDSLGNGSVLRHYEMNQEIPTYLAGIAVGNYESWQTTHTGAFGEVPLEILALPNNLSTVVNSFQYLDESVDALEKWWGAYPWERVGYVMTGNGAMEHPTNVAYPLFLASNGPVPVHNEVMSHELGHHWWGDLVTLTGPENMWIKEGPAEYSSHLFYEHVFGKSEFNRVVMENLLLVLEEAHLDDGDYLALSPMPYEQTYGTHTYQKGALVIHNLRGYLGDSLFVVGMRSALETFAYGSMDAAQFRDQLTAATGVDLNPFFDAWIFAPGYAAYEIENMVSTPQGANFEVELSVQQKLLAATVFHEQVPMTVTFVDDNFNFYKDKIVLSGEFSNNNFILPFEPSVVFLNEDYLLNLAVTGSNKTVTETGQAGIGYGGMGIKILEIVDSAFLRVEEYRVAPDPSPINVYDAKFSKNHYFRVTGVLKDGFLAKGTIFYDGKNPEDIDYDLVSVTEDSLVLLYRPSPTEDWYEYPSYEVKFLGLNTDGQGAVFVEPLQLGEYTLANAVVPPTSNEDILLEKNQWTIFPNPASKEFAIEGAFPFNGISQITLYDIQGKKVLQEAIEVKDNHFTKTINTHSLPNGVYVLKIIDSEMKFQSDKPQMITIEHN